LIYTRDYGENIEPTKRLWAMGNYSRYVRPGAVRLDVTSDNELVRVSAYRDASNGAVTVVVINNSGDAQSIRFDGLDAVAQTVNAYETSDAYDLAEIYNSTPQSSYYLAPTSVTTFVFRNEQGA
jgi:O-glycosyl hydrolase